VTDYEAVLFLLRPRQTWMPYASPRDPEQQRAWNDQLQQAYSSTRRVDQPAPAAGLSEQLRSLGELHDTGVLDDTEFAAAKARLLEPGTST
jgi:hypothetical protein